MNLIKKNLFKSPLCKVVGFFHPNADAAAGGEKVLFSALKALVELNKDGNSERKLKLVVYVTSSLTKKAILEKITARFGIQIEENEVTFVSIPFGYILKPENYPSFTILWQAVAQIQCLLWAYLQFPCDVMVESVGAGYGYLALKTVFKPVLVSYTHYP